MSLLPVLGLGLVLSSILREAIESRTESVYASTTTAMFNMAADVIARPEDFAAGQPLPPERAAIVDELIRRIGVDDEQVRVRMVTPDGTVVYGTNAGDVGTTIAATGGLRAALQGDPDAKLVRGAIHPGQTEPTDIIEIYVPVRFSGDETVYGAIVAAGINRQMVRIIDTDIRRMYTALVGGLAALWVVLLPIASSLSRRLRRQAAENRYLALHDTLTGLPNRNLLADRLQRAISATARTGELVGLLLIDLDHFKDVNDTLGHGKGDQLLELVAARLAGTVRGADTVARLGGDEFAIVVTGLHDVTELVDVAERISRELVGEVPIDGVSVAVQASIGGAVYPVHADGAEELLQHADIAMYAAKSSGEDFLLYSADIDSHSPSRLALAAELGRALQCDDQIVLHYQPVASPATGEVESMEALVRWQHPARGLLAPIDFIPMAEQSGLIRRVTTKVLDLAGAQARTWIDAGLNLTVAVNLSASDLQSARILDDVAEVLQRYDLPADRLELEVTETGVLAQPETAVELIGALRRTGVRIALDDFGTGYSSLTYLKRLNPDRLKIDRSFVDAMVHQPTDAQIVRSLIELAHNLSIGVTAEGVETAEHWDQLRALSCDLVQGYYLARPMDASAVRTWLSDHAGSSTTHSR